MLSFKEYLDEATQVNLSKAVENLQRKGWEVYFFNTEAKAKKFLGVAELIKPGWDIAFKQIVCLEPYLAKQLSNSHHDALYSAYEKIQ